MSLFEAVYQDAPSLLISAASMGEALRHISNEFGLKAIYQLEQLLELQPDNFVLMRRCGALHHYSSYKSCPSSEHRLFLVRHPLSSEQAIFSVTDVKYLPLLILEHFELVRRDERNLEGVLRLWNKYQREFLILEINTEMSGVLLIYNYCCCPEEAHQVLVPPVSE